MNIELNITKDKTTLKLPCGCVIDYDSRAIIKECNKHKELE